METKVPYHKWFVIDGATMIMRVHGGALYKCTDWGGEDSLALSTVFVPMSRDAVYAAILPHLTTAKA